MKTQPRTERHQASVNLLIRALLLGLVLLALAGCGGGGGGDDSEGGIIGTGVIGTAAQGDAIANASVELKALGGSKKSSNTDASGKFSITDINAEGPYLIRADIGSSNFLYSVAHGANGSTVTRNIHPFTDLIIKNWFQTKGLDINAEFNSDSAIAMMPTQAEIDAIKDEITAIVAQVLISYGVGSDIDLLATPFDADGTGFDNFIANNLVFINNNQITVVINDPVTNIQSTSIDNLSLGTDFTAANDNPPTTPENLRALSAGADEIVVVWEPSTDDKGVSGYNVYRNGELVGSTPYPVFSDTGLVAGTAYSYEVEAFDSRGQVSTRTSATTPLTLDTPDTTAPPAPTAVKTSVASNTIQLDWTQTQINDVVGFQILRGAKGNANTPVATITATSNTDYNLIPATEYCYRVKAFDGAGNESAPSEESCAFVAGADQGPSSVTFSAATYQVADNVPSMIITVNRAGNIADAISVDYDASAGTAIDGQDFTATSGTLNWAANDNAPKTFMVQIISDTAVEGDETVQLSLRNPSPTTSLGSNASATLTISDSVQVACTIVLEQKDITVDTTLDQPCYQAPNGLDVQEPANLTLAPGVRLEFAAGRGLSVRNGASLTAIGTATAPITLTGTQATLGWWDGVVFFGSNNTRNELDFVTVEYGGDPSGFAQANVRTTGSSRLKMRRSTLRNSASYGLYVETETLLDAFSENNLTGNDTPAHIAANLVGKLDSASSYIGNTNEFIHIIKGSKIVDNQSWQALSAPYLLLNGGFTNVDSQLTIAPGTTLIFQANGNLNITRTGTLIAKGTVENPIVFTAEQPTPGYWHGIQFTFTDNANVLDHVVVEYAGGGIGNGEGNVTVYGHGTLKMTNTLLRDGQGYGFDFDDAIIDGFANVTSVNNAKGPGQMPANLVGKLDANSVFSGDTLLPLSLDGNISDDQTWRALDVPYFHSSSGNIDLNAHLTIEAGAELIFNSSARLNVSRTGSLNAQGTAANPITFTGNIKQAGYWNGIQFTFSDFVSNILDHVVVEYAGKPEGNTEALVGLYSTSRATITNSVLRESSTHGIWLDANSNSTLEGNRFENITGQNVLSGQ